MYSTSQLFSLVISQYIILEMIYGLKGVKTLKDSLHALW